MSRLPLARRSALSLALVLGGLLTPALADAHQSKITFHMKERTTFDSLISSFDWMNQDIDAWAVEPDGDWIIVADGNVWNSAGMDSDIVTGAKLNLFFGRDIEAIDCRADGYCVLVHSMGSVSSDGTFPSGFTTRVNWYHNFVGDVRDVELTPGGGWIVLGPGNYASYTTTVDYDLRSAIYDRHAADRSIRDIDVDFDGNWVVLADNNPMSYEISSGFKSALRSWTEAERDTDRILSGKDGDWVVFNADDDFVSPDLTDPIEGIEYSLAGGKNIWERMGDYGVPGLAIAVIDGNEVIYARGYGEQARYMPEPILARTPFDVASLSKYVGALSVLAQLEKERSIDLDDDIFSYVPSEGIVDTWRDRLENDPDDYDFGSADAIPGQGFTLRELLSHTSGMRTGGSTPISYAASLHASCQKSTVEFMSGLSDTFMDCDYDSTGNSGTYYDSANGAPGFDYNYANAGLYLAQATVEDLSGKTGANLAKDELFAPMGLTRITGAYPLSSGWVQADAGHFNLDTMTRDSRDVYPMTYSGGITSSVADYAELVILALNNGKDSNGTKILEPSSITELLERVDYTNYGVNPNNYALGVGVGNVGGDDNAENFDGVFRHAGRHAGNVATFMCGNPTRDQGLVIFMNADDASDSSVAQDLRDEIRTAYRATVGWPSGC